MSASIAMMGITRTVMKTTSKLGASISNNNKKPIGRDVELTILRERIKDMGAFRDGGVLIFEGETGIGKTKLCTQVHRSAMSNGFLALRAECQAAHSKTPYFPLQQVVEEYFDIKDLPMKEARESIRAQLEEAHPELWAHVSLLNSIVPLEFEESFEIRTLGAVAKMENTKRFLMDLLQTAADTARRVVLICEDVHWMDSLTWSLLADLCASVRPLLVVITHRLWTEEDVPPVEYEEIVQLERTNVMGLRRLTRDESTRLVCRMLRAKEVPEVLLAVVINRASGNPFFIGELVRYLVSAHMVTVKKGVAEVGSAFGADNIPGNAFAMSCGRFSLLSEPHQLILKVASVLDGAFNATIMRGVHPLPHMQTSLEEQFVQLQKRGYLELSTEPAARALHVWSMDHQSDSSEGRRNVMFPLPPTPPSPFYVFSHSMLRDVIYQMVPLKQRQELHRSAARFFEASQSVGGAVSAMDSMLAKGEAPTQQDPDERIDPPVVALTLAHHWSQTDEPGRAAKYFVAAGWDALLRFGNMEAVGHFSEAFELAADGEGAGVVAESLPRSKLVMLAGEAFFSRGVLDMAGEHYRESLVMAGYKLEPSGPVKLVVRMMLVQMHRRSARHCAAQAQLQWNDDSSEESFDMGPRERGLGCIGINDAAHCYERLASVHASERWLSLYYSLMQLRLLQSDGGNCPPAATLRALSIVSHTASMINLGAQAQRYALLAQSISRSVADAASLSIANRLVGMQALGQGNWADAEQMFDTAVSLGTRLQDWHGWYESLSYVAIVHTLLGRYTTAEKVAQQVLESVMLTDNESSHAWAYCTLFMVQNVKGPVTGEAPLTHLQDLERLMEPVHSEHDDMPPKHLSKELLVAGHGVAALARLRRGETHRALHHVIAHLHLTDPRAHDLDDLDFDETHDEEGNEIHADDLEPEEPTEDATSVFSIIAQMAVVETCIGLWDQGLGEEHELRSLALRALGALRHAARIMPVAQPRVLLFAGHLARLRGKRKTMVREWTACLKLSREREMTYELACSYLALSTWSGAGPQKRRPDLAAEQRRRANLCAAQEAFESLEGTIAELQKVKALAIRIKSNPSNFPVVRGKRSTDVWPRLRQRGLSLAWLCSRNKQRNKGGQP